MNPWQLAQQIKHELGQVTWPGGSGEVVFGSRSVLVYAGALAEDEHPPGFPFAFVTIGAGTPDPDDPDVIEQQFSVATAVEVAGDPLGEHAVIGGARADIGRSQGAGIAEVAERVRSTLQTLTAADGASAVVTGSGIGAPAVLGRGKQLAFDEYTVSALCTSAARYTAPQELQVAGDTWSWRGEWCVPRFDFVSFTLGYVAGASAVATVAELDGIVYTGTADETAAAPVAGRTYQVFAGYNGHGGATVDTYSDAVVGSFIVV